MLLRREKKPIFEKAGNVVAFVAGSLAIVTSSILLYQHFYPAEVTWHMGKWSVDIEKSMPALNDKREIKAAAFTPEQIAEMNWPEPGHDLKDLTFIFNKHTGTAFRAGNSQSKTPGTVQINNELITLGSETGLSSIIKYELEIESKDKIIVKELERDYVVRYGLPAAMSPPSYLIKNGDSIQFQTSFYITNKRCRVDDESDCSSTTEFFPTHYYLKQVDDDGS